MLRSGRLRRTLLLTIVVAFGVAVLPIPAVGSADLGGALKITAGSAGTAAAGAAAGAGPLVPVAAAIGAITPAAAFAWSDSRRE